MELPWRELLALATLPREDFEPGDSGPLWAERRAESMMFCRSAATAATASGARRAGRGGTQSHHQHKVSSRHAHGQPHNCIRLCWVFTCASLFIVVVHERSDCRELARLVELFQVLGVELGRVDTTAEASLQGARAVDAPLLILFIQEVINVDCHG